MTVDIFEGLYDSSDTFSREVAEHKEQKMAQRLHPHPQAPSLTREEAQYVKELERLNPNLQFEVAHQPVTKSVHFCGECRFFDADAGLAGYGKCSMAGVELENHPWPHNSERCDLGVLR